MEDKVVDPAVQMRMGAVASITAEKIGVPIKFRWEEGKADFWFSIEGHCSMEEDILLDEGAVESLLYSFSVLVERFKERIVGAESATNGAS